jgi:cell division septation protein DedD
VNKKTTPSKKDAKRKYHIEMTSWTIFAWLSCLFLLMSWIFVLGILVGRGFIPQSVTAIADIRNQLNKLQERVFHDQKPVQGAHKEEDYDTKLAFYNELSSKKEEEKRRNFSEAEPGHVSKESGQKKQAENEQASPEPKAEASKAEAPAKETVAKVKTEISKALPGASQKESAENVAKKRATPSAKNGYTVQVASLEDGVKARETVERLKKGGYDAYYEKVQIRGKTWYRIRCGKFATKDEAENHAKKLAGETRLKGLVMKLE